MYVLREVALRGVGTFLDMRDSLVITVARSCGRRVGGVVAGPVLFAAGSYRGSVLSSR